MSFSKIKRSDLQFGKELGRGGFSTVYKAKWRLSFFKSQDVAVKKLNKSQVSELEIMSKLEHENIVKLLAVVDEHPDFFLIQELCHGGSLRAYLNNLKKEGKRLPNDHFYDWAKQAARPIEYLKKMGIIHKDVKSENYVIADQNTLKLTDFGLAKETEETIDNATGSATPAYMAPELVRELKLSPTYDIFSYGVVVWELWTTDKPFEGLERQVIIWKVCQLNEHPPIPADCPKHIADLIRQCWLVKREERPSIEHVLTVITDAEKETVKAAAAAAAVANATRQEQLLNGSWVLEREIGTDGPGWLEGSCGIAVNTNGDIAAASFGARCIKVYSTQGAHKFNLDTSIGLKPGTTSYPRDVTASPDGHYYYVTDWTQYLKCYTNTGLYKDKWVAISPDGKPSDTEDTKLYGLVIDTKNQLLVGECKLKYISKHRLDGSHIASIKVDIEPFSLAVTSHDTIIVSDCYPGKSVHIIDNSGQLLHAINPPNATRWEPRDIICIDDIICICNGRDDRIQCFSLSGEHLGVIPIQFPLDPICLTFTPDGKKLMVTYGSVLSSPSGIAVYRLQI